MENPEKEKALLNVDNLFISFNSIKAVDGISFSIGRNEILALAGESGSGKSVTALSIPGLLNKQKAKVSGKIIFSGEDLMKMGEKELRAIRGKKIALIFQDPLSYLNPFFRISTQMIRALRLHEKISRKKAKERAVRMLEKVGIKNAKERIECYPHQLSGGMRQRVMIAMALLCSPDFLIADEPTASLDVTLEAQILDLLKRMEGMSILLISHNLESIRRTADRILVMYKGKIVEEARAEMLFKNPMHPYTVDLISAIPGKEIRPPHAKEKKMIPAKGNGCRFYERCISAEEICRRKQPPLFSPEEGHSVACWKYGGRDGKS